MKDVATMKVELKKLIDTAAGRIPADLVIKDPGRRHCIFR